MIALLLSAVLSSPAPLPDPQDGPRPSDLGALDVDARVFHDVDEQGDLWARGARWKMRFGKEGAIQGTGVLDQELFIYYGFELGGMLRDFDLAVDGQRFVLGYNSSGYAGLATLTLEPLASQIATLEHVIADWILDSKWEGGLATRHEAGGASGKGLQTWATNWPSYPYDPDVWTAFYQPQ